MFSSVDSSGLITLYASREKKRTFCPVPGVFGSRRIDRTEPSLLSIGESIEGREWELSSVTERKTSRDGRLSMLAKERTVSWEACVLCFDDWRSAVIWWDSTVELANEV